MEGILLVPLDEADNVGMLVSDIMLENFLDAEADTLGMCVVLAQSSGRSVHIIFLQADITLVR